MVDHEVQLTGATIAGQASLAPVLLDRRDPDFLAEMLRQYRSTEQQAELLDQVVPRKDTPPAPYPVLYQPVQRVMHLAMMEAFCLTPGSPRLDHSKIDSAGVVVRRVPMDKDTRKPDFHSPNLECWMQQPNGRASWIPRNPTDQQLDPDPSRRRLPHTGQSYLDVVLNDHINGAPMSEAFSPAFPAPPDVCAEAKKTLIYAVLPLTSAEISATPLTLNFDKAALVRYLPVLIQSGNNITPLAGRSITADYASEDFLNTNLSSIDQAHFRLFLNLLNAAVDFGIFDNDAPAESATLRVRLHELSVVFQLQTKLGQSTTNTQPLDQFLASAKTLLIDRNPAAPSIQMPTQWPAVTAQQQDALLAALEAVVQRRLTSLGTTSAGDLRGSGRYQNPDRIYRVFGFVRVKSEEGCPPKVVWSKPSILFRIAPWYEGPGVPLPPVILPDLTDKNALNKLKPNVSFGVPAGIFNSMQGASLDGLMKGKKPGGGMDLDWICGFNIPIITICAFFVLNIFLSLLNIIFFWLPLVKICIPIPKGTLNSD